MEQAFGPAIAAIAALILIAGPMAVGVAKITDLVRNVGDAANTWPKWVWNVVPMVIGIAVCVGWSINLMEAVVAAIPALADKAGTQELAGEVITGVIVGGMAGFWHDKMDAWHAWAVSRRATTTPTDTF